MPGYPRVPKRVNRKSHCLGLDKLSDWVTKYIGIGRSSVVAQASEARRHPSLADLMKE